MDRQFNYDVLTKLKRKKHKKIWKRILCVMMCLVVFCTTYMLILPAITKETKTYCGLEEHTHTDSCYRNVPLCQIHVHTDTCFTDDDELICTLEADPDHIHTDACEGRELICGKEEHTHSKTCFSDLKSDLETEEIWRATLPKLTGVSKENIVAIAKSQLNYTESSNNYLVDNDGNIKGYTRYGDWYGDPYGDWNAMFVAFCLRYAGVNYPYDASCSAWVTTLREQNLLKIPSEYVPEIGDIVFLDWEQDGIVDHVGLVETIDGINFTTIEGDVENCVAKNTYDLFDERIVGYGFVDIPETETFAENTEESGSDISALNDREAWAELVPSANTEIQTYKEQPRAYSSRSNGIAGTSTFALRGSGTTNQASARAITLDLTPYINTVNMYDSEGKLIPNGAVVTEGDTIEFKIEYTITGQQLGVMNGENVTVKSDTLLYTLPKIFEMVQSDSGDIINSRNDVVGTYVIDSAAGTITMNFTEDYVEQNALGMQVHGYISFSSIVTKVTDFDSEYQDFEFTDSIKLGVTIEEKNEAVGDLKIEKQKLSVDGEEIIYQIKVSSTEGTNGSITIKDEMSDGLTFVEGLGVWKANGSSVSNANFKASVDRSSFTLTLPEMAPGDSYVVKYRCAADIDLLGGDMTVRNTASVNGKDSHDKELEDKVTVDHTFDMLKKTGKANDDGSITWHITINQAEADISGWVLEDVLGGTAYTGRITISDTSGKVLAQDVSLPYTFPNGSKSTYVVTYTTTHTIAEGDTIYNKVILRDDDTEVTVLASVGVGSPIIKTGEAGSVIEDENGNFLLPITWTVTIDTTNSAIEAGEYLYDKMNGSYHTADMYMTYDQLMAALRAIEAELNRVGSYSSYVYIEGYVSGYSTGASYGQTYNMDDLENDPACKDYLYERFTIVLGEDVPKGELLTFSYETYGIYPNNVVVDQDYKNRFNISENYEVEALVKFSSGTLKATKYALSYYDPSIPNQKWHWSNTHWDGVEGISRFEYEKLHDSYLGWSIELSIPPGYSNTDDLVIYEDLPEGVSVKSLGMPFLSDMPVSYLQLKDMEAGQTYEWTFKIYPIDQYDVWEPQRTGGYDITIMVKVTEAGDLEITLPGSLLRLMGDLAKRHSQAEWYSYLNIYTQINDNFEWTPQSPGSYVYVDSFQNRFTIKDEDGEVIDVGSQTQIITKDESKGVIRKEASTDNNNVITYSVILNAYDKDLIENSGVLYIHDELTYTSTDSSPLRLRLVPGSVKLYDIRLASDGNYTKLKELTTEYSYNEVSTEQGGITSWVHTIDLEVPDDKALLLEYSYKASGDKNATYDVLNNCTIKGVGEGTLDGDHKLEIEVKEATAQANTEGVMLYKVDSDSDGIFLEKARFNLYIWNEEQNKYILVHHPENGSSDFVTDVNGMIILDAVSLGTEQFSYNTAYYIVEIESPEGYYLDPEPYYFYIANDNTVAYPKCIPEGFAGQPLTSGDIIYRKNVNEITKIRVEKYWQDYDGKVMTVTGKEVSSVTLELWQMLEGNPNSAKRYGTYTMTPDNDGNWSLTITGLPKATKNADGTKKTDYLYYIKEVKVGGYALESAENNSGINSGTIKLINRKQDGYALPQTGGIGHETYITVGLLLVFISTVLLVKNHRKSRKRNYHFP